jgi:hypothetical protein
MNIDNKARQQIIALSVLAGSFLIALVFYLAMPPSRVERTLFFPGAIEQSLDAETRLVPRSDGLRQAVEALVRELVLGPVSIASARSLPKDTKVNVVAVRENTVYIDLSEEVALDEADVNLTFDERLEVVESSVLRNFRNVGEVVVTINGQLAYVPHHNLAESRN